VRHPFRGDYPPPGAAGTALPALPGARVSREPSAPTGGLREDSIRDLSVRDPDQQTSRRERHLSPSLQATDVLAVEGGASMTLGRPTVPRRATPLSQVLRPLIGELDLLHLFARPSVENRPR
jgi:hypothetical protein